MNLHSNRVLCTNAYRYNELLIQKKLPTSIVDTVSVLAVSLITLALLILLNSVDTEPPLSYFNE